MITRGVIKFKVGGMADDQTVDKGNFFSHNDIHNMYSSDDGDKAVIMFSRIP